MKDIYKVYGISDCPACLRACAYLMEDYPHKEYVFVNCDFSSTFRDGLKEVYQVKTFPIVTKVTAAGERLIGGWVELQQLAPGINLSYEAPPMRDPT